MLRTALSLSLVTGQPFVIEKIRAKREKPGLLRQHLTAVLAAMEIGSATVEGATLGSKTLTFTPGKVRAGEYRFAVGTAGSSTLVFQTILPALMTASGRSRLVIEGGTHNTQAPPFDFLAKTFLPILSQLGPRVTVKLERYGFYPRRRRPFHCGNRAVCKTFGCFDERSWRNQAPTRDGHCCQSRPPYRSTRNRDSYALPRMGQRSV